MPLYEITVERNCNTYTVSGYFNNRLVKCETSHCEYELDAENRSYSLLFPEKDRETDTVFISRDDNSYGHLVGMNGQKS
jgi:hypothetical protein